VVEFGAVEEQAPVLFVVRDLALSGQLVEPLRGPVEVGGSAPDVDPRRASLVGLRWRRRLQLLQPAGDAVGEALEQLVE
jgi:hypothetical protein